MPKKSALAWVVRPRPLEPLRRLKREAAEKAHFKVDQAAPLATVEELPEVDAIIIGTPTCFGNRAAQMKIFLDQAGGLWFTGKLVRTLNVESGAERALARFSGLYSSLFVAM